MAAEVSRGVGRNPRAGDWFLLVLQWLFGVYFLAVGVMHFVVPAGLPEFLGWMYELEPEIHFMAGIVEILGGLGLVVPWTTGIKPILTPIAAGGLALVMIVAIVWHAGRGELGSIGANLIVLIAMGFIGAGRWSGPESSVSRSRKRVSRH